MNKNIWGLAILGMYCMNIIAMDEDSKILHALYNKNIDLEFIANINEKRASRELRYGMGIPIDIILNRAQLDLKKQSEKLKSLDDKSQNDLKIINQNFNNARIAYNIVAAKTNPEVFAKRHCNKLLHVGWFSEVESLPSHCIEHESLFDVIGYENIAAIKFLINFKPNIFVTKSNIDKLRAFANCYQKADLKLYATYIAYRSSISKIDPIHLSKYDVEHCIDKGWFSEAIFIMACNPNLVDIILYLNKAIAAKNRNAVMVLMRFRPNIYAQDSNGNTIFYNAIKSDCTEIIEQFAIAALKIYADIQ